jgi:capsular exopolysaccharide synthesis family protein
LDPQTSYELEGDARSPFAVLRQRWRVVLVVTLLAGAAAAAFAYVNRDTYESTAKMVFRQSFGPELNAIGLVPTSPDVDNLQQDNVQLVDSRAVAVATAAQLQRRGVDVSAADVDEDVSVSGTKDSDVVQVTAKAESARRAALLANVYATTAARLADAGMRRQAARTLGALETQLKQLTPSQRNGGLGEGLRLRIATLRVLAQVGDGSPRIIQPGYVPSSKSGSPVQTILLGLLFGLVLGAGVALLREQASRRLYMTEQLGVVFGAPVLSSVPQDRALKRNRPFHELPPRVAEAFRMLHTNLRYVLGTPVRSVVVTSARRGEGKTTVAWNLACAAASTGLSVAVVEADLRRPTLAERYGLEAEPGLAELLFGEASVPDVGQILELPMNGRANGRLNRLHVIVAGRPPEDPWAVMQSGAAGQILAHLKAHVDLVVVDAPPITHAADAISLLGDVDGVVVVASVDSTRGPAARRLREQLHALKTRVLGVVATGSSDVTGYAYAPGGDSDGRGLLSAGTTGTPRSAERTGTPRSSG